MEFDGESPTKESQKEKTRRVQILKF